MATRFRTYGDVLAYLARFTDYERAGPPKMDRRDYNLDRMRSLLESVGRPHERFRSLHIAGTKGKGSVAIFTEAILRRCGLRTGLYTSPHLLDLLERIQVEGRSVSRPEFVAAVEDLRPAIERVRPTFFEILTAAAFVLFARRRVDVAVVEVGMGGRLDATNVLTPAACAITRIDYDHTAVLGRTLGKIAAEKAGILKPGVPAVVAAQRPAAMRAIRNAARRAGAVEIGPVRTSAARTVWSPRGFMLECTVDGRRIRLPVAGTHQAENVGVAVALARRAARPGFAELRDALGGARVPGRIEWVARRPDVVIDVAHNPVSSRSLRETLDRLAPGRPRLLVFGTPEDKDARGMLRELLRGVRLALFTRSSNPRAADPERLAELAGRRPHLIVGSVPRALDLARRIARRDDLVVVAGSFVVAGEALAALESGGEG